MTLVHCCSVSASIQDILGKLLSLLGLPFTGIVVQEEEGITRVDIETPEPSRIIGWHGESLNALQHLLKSIVRSQENLDRAPFLVLDVDGYRRAQERKVCDIALAKADFVRRKKTRLALPPMSPYFRRVVHLFVAHHPDLQDLTTESVGEGDYRQIVLRLKAAKSDDGELSPVIAQEVPKDSADAVVISSLDDLDI